MKGIDNLNKRLRGYATVLSVIFGILAFAPLVLAVDATWPVLRHDPQGTGMSPYVGPLEPGIKWRLDYHGSNSPPVISADGTLYVSGDDDVFYAVKPDGTIKWTVDINFTGYSFQNSPAVGPDGTIYVRGDGDSNLLALDPADGHELWRVNVGSGYGPPVVGNDGTIYISDSAWDTILHAYNPNGTLKWEAPDVGREQYIALSPDGTRVYIGGYNLSCLDATDGTILWEVDPGDADPWHPAVGPDGTVYANYRWNNFFVALDPADGREKWSVDIGARGAGLPAIDAARNTIYVASEAQYLYAISFEGDLKWTFPCGILWDWHHPVIGGDGTVYITDNARSILYALEPDTGEEKWEIKLGNVEWRPPVIGADGTLYITTYSELLIAVGEQERTIFEGNEYFFVHKPMTWHEARDYARSLGGHLVTTSDFDENAFVNDLSSEIAGGQGRTGACWIGLTDEANPGDFVWVTGEPLVFEAWYYNPPAPEHYVAMVTWCCYGPWENYHGTDLKQFVVEFEGISDTLGVHMIGPDRINPGDEATFMVFYSNRLEETARDVILTVDIPINFTYVSSTQNGIYRHDSRYDQVFWKLGDLQPGAYGKVTATMAAPWGLPEYTGSVRANIGARNAASALPIPIDDYLTYSPSKIIFEKRLTQGEIDGHLASDPELRALFDYGLELGYVFHGVGQQVIFSDGSDLMRLVMLDPEAFGPALLSKVGAVSFFQKYAGDTFAIFDRNGGYRYDPNSRDFDVWGSWLEHNSPTFATCLDNCLVTMAKKYAAKKIADHFKKISAGYNCTKCAGTQFTDTEACEDCENDLIELGIEGTPLESLKDAVENTKDAAACFGDCYGNPEKYTCRENTAKVECTTNEWGQSAYRYRVCGKSWLWAFTGAYKWGSWTWSSFTCPYSAPCDDSKAAEYIYDPQAAAIEPEPCGDPCFNATESGSLILGTRSYHRVSFKADASSGPAVCETKRYDITPAHDPNAKSVDVSGNVIPGQMLTYTIEYENEGAGTAYDVFILDELDPNLDETTLVIQNGGTYSQEGRLLSWDIGELSPGQQGQVTFSVNVRDGLAGGTEITNFAEVHFPSAYEITPTNPVVNVVSLVTADPQSVETVSGAPLGIILTGGDAGGSPLFYRITSRPVNGELTGTPPDVTYTSAENFNGMDRFSFTAHNGVTQSNPAMVRIRVNPSPYDVTPPEVTRTYPGPGGTGIRVSNIEIGPDMYPPTLTATFSEPVNPDTVNTSTFTVNGLTGNVSYDVLTRTAYFHPSVPLLESTVYTATLTTGVRDNSGNPMAANHIWNFTTVGAVALEVTLPPPGDFLSFGTVPPETTTDFQIVSVSNAGRSDLVLGNIGLSGSDPSAFLVGEDVCSGQTLRNGEICTVQVAFSPDTDGEKGALLQIPSNDPHTPYEVLLTGRAQRGLLTRPFIEVNDAGGTVHVDPARSADISVALTPDDMAGIPVDWWIGVFTPFGTYWLDPFLSWRPSNNPISVGQFGMFDLGKTSILNIQLPFGLYTFFFILDDNPDGILNNLSWYDYVNVVCYPDRVGVESTFDPDDLFRNKMNALMTP